MAISPDRVAANRANARKSTGPRTPEGKARASQNARKHPFDTDYFAIVRIEDRARLASLVAGAIATYQPINSQERAAVERIALAQNSMLRMYTLEAGFFTNCLDHAMEGPARPVVLQQEITNGFEIPLAQHRAFWIAFGFNRFTQKSNIAATFLRFQAQAERLHRRAVEDFHRLLKLRDQLPPEEYDEPNEESHEEPNEPNIEPVLAAQPAENTAAPLSDEPIPEPLNEPNPEPPPPALQETPHADGRADDNRRPMLVPAKQQPTHAPGDSNRHAPRSRDAP
jgi:hypothetical protein